MTESEEQQWRRLSLALENGSNQDVLDELQRLERVLVHVPLVTNFEVTMTIEERRRRRGEIAATLMPWFLTYSRDRVGSVRYEDIQEEIRESTTAGWISRAAKFAVEAADELAFRVDATPLPDVDDEQQ